LRTIEKVADHLGMLQNTRLKWREITYTQNKECFLGEGTFGKVYEGTATEWIRVPGKTTKEARELKLAVKIFNNQSPSAAEQKLFMRELEVGCRAQHPCLLGFVSFSFTPYAIAMEKEHITLGEVLEMEGKGQHYEYRRKDGETVEWNDTRRSMAAFGIAVGMCYLHEHGIIHRDLKSDNVMLDEYLRPRIGDFGLSKVLGAADEAVNKMITQTMNAGTPIFMAPELFIGIGSGEYTMAVDVYSYAGILYHLVTWSLPWENKFQKEEFLVMSYLQKGQRPVIPDFVLPVYKQLIEACWAQNASARPSFRDIVEQTKGEVLCGGDCDVNEFLEYQEEVLAKLDKQPARR
jgi:serine/threonine protein kinase